MHSRSDCTLGLGTGTIQIFSSCLCRRVYCWMLSAFFRQVDHFVSTTSATHPPWGKCLWNIVRRCRGAPQASGDGLKPVVTVPFLVKLSESQNNKKKNWVHEEGGGWQVGRDVVGMHKTAHITFYTCLKLPKNKFNKKYKKHAIHFLDVAVCWKHYYKGYSVWTEDWFFFFFSWIGRELTECFLERTLPFWLGNKAVGRPGKMKMLRLFGSLFRAKSIIATWSECLVRCLSSLRSFSE